MTASHGPHPPGWTSAGGKTDACAAAQDLLEKVIETKRGCGERPDETGRVGMSPQGDRGELQAGYPALGAVFQRGRCVGGQREAHSGVEEPGSFRSVETQVGRAQLRKLPPCAPSGQRQAGILPRGNDQAHPGRKAIEKEGQGLVGRRGIDQVVVVGRDDSCGRSAIS
jgi:hypothetical protein